MSEEIAKNEAPVVESPPVITPNNPEEYAKRSAKLVDRSSSETIESGKRLLDGVIESQNPDTADSDGAKGELDGTNEEIATLGEKTIGQIETETQDTDGTTPSAMPLASETSEQTAETPDNEEAPEKTERDDYAEVNKWLAIIKIKIDHGLADIFEKAIAEEKKEKPDKTLLEVAKLLKELPRLFAGATSEISKLIGKEGYSEIEEKQVDIIKGYCLPVINGHITAEDCLALGKKISIVSRENPPAEVLRALKNNSQGYDGVMYYYHNEIFIFKETLVDNYVTKNGEGIDLDIQHMLTHEISHPVVDAIFRKNERLIAKCDEIIDGASELKDSQSMHIRNTLEGLANVDSDFEEYFNKNIAPTEQFKSIPETDRAKFIAAEKSEFERKRRQIAVTEIMTEYTAMYLQSDRSFGSFMMNCLDKTYLNDKAGAFGISIETLLELRKTSSNEEEFKTVVDKARGNNTKFAKILNIFQTFYSEIKKGIEENSGKFNEIISEQGIDDELDYGYLDGGYGFSNNGSALQNETSGKGGGGPGFFGTLVELAKAFDEGVNPIKVG